MKVNPYEGSFIIHWVSVFLGRGPNYRIRNGVFLKMLENFQSYLGGTSLYFEYAPPESILVGWLYVTRWTWGALESPANFERSPTVRIFLQADEAKSGMT